MHEQLDRVVSSAETLCPTQPGIEGLGALAGSGITIMLASNRLELHASWRSMLELQSGIAITNDSVVDADCLATCVECHQPNILLLDKPLLDALDHTSLRRIQDKRRHVRVLLLWDENYDGLVADVLHNQLHGFLLTTCTPEVCIKAIRAVSKGELWLSRTTLTTAIAGLFDTSKDSKGRGPAHDPHVNVPDALTPRELQVVALLRQGRINKEIAHELGIMEDTVKKHLQSVFAKLGVRRRALVALRPFPATALPIR